jgi:hypothetical protein
MTDWLKDRYSIQQSPSSGFWPFRITHFNTIVLTFITLLTDQDETRWPASQLLVSPAVAQCTLKSVKLCLLLSEDDHFNVSSNEMPFYHIIYLMLPKCLYFTKIHAFYFWYFISFLNQTGTLHWKWVPVSMLVMLMITLSVPNLSRTLILYCTM